MLYGSDKRGVARLIEGDRVEILDLQHWDLSAAFRAGLTRSDLDAALVRETIAASDVALRAPVPEPRAVWITGANYDSHRDEIKEVNMQQSEWPLTMLIPSVAVTGPNDPIVLPWRAGEQVDYEGELVVVIGRTAKDVSEQDAMDHIFGFTAGNDVSARDVQLGRYLDDSPDYSKSKGFDSFKPLGPWIATTDEYEDPNDIRVRTWVDGELRQDGRTSDLIFTVSAVVAFLSSFTTLEPGDVILTGTPSGVGINGLGEHLPPFSGGNSRERPAIGEWVSTLTGDWLRPGNRVRVEVEGAGAIENEVVAAPMADDAVVASGRAVAR